MSLYQCKKKNGRKEMLNARYTFSHNSVVPNASVALWCL